MSWYDHPSAGEPEPEREERPGSAAPASEETLAVVPPTGLTNLGVPVPPMLEEALGYTRRARFVAFFWGAGDEAYYADGRVEATGEWAPYRLFVQHHRVWPALRGFDFGSSEAPARDHFLLDRRARILYAGPTRVARAVLAAQWPQPNIAELAAETPREGKELLKRLREQSEAASAAEALLTPAQRGARIAAVMARQRAVEEALVAWLRALPQRPVGPEDAEHMALERGLADLLAKVGMLPEHTAETPEERSSSEAPSREGSIPADDGEDDRRLHQK